MQRVVSAFSRISLLLLILRASIRTDNTMEIQHEDVAKRSPRKHKYWGGGRAKLSVSHQSRGKILGFLGECTKKFLWILWFADGQDFHSLPLPLENYSCETNKVATELTVPPVHIQSIEYHTKSISTRLWVNWKKKTFLEMWNWVSHSYSYLYDPLKKFNFGPL